MQRFVVASACALAWAAILPPMPAQASGQPINLTSPLGTNLAAVNYYASEWVFVDLFKAAAPWWPQRTDSSVWDTGAPLQQTPDGWIASLGPNEAAGTLLCRGLDGHYPGGRYILTYAGNGAIQLGFDATKIVNQTAGRIEFDVTPSDGGIYLKLLATDPNNPVRDIRVVHQSMFGQNLTFHPRFLTVWSAHRVLRFMDWQRTNNASIQHWSQRTTTTSYTQDQTNGVAVEYMIELANTLNADPWFCIPHLATDDYVVQFARLVRDRLNPTLKAYVEYSNEVWNPIFQQHAHAQQQGLALGLSTNPFEATLRYYSQRSVEVFALWAQEFGGTRRLHRVLAAQNANAYTAQEVCDWQNAYQNADLLAVAPYFGYSLGDPSTQNVIANDPVEVILLKAYGDIASVMRNVRLNGWIGAARGLRLVAYEGGQHLAGYNGAENNAALAAKLIAANQHPYMGLLLRYFLDEWRRNGGTNFVHYNSVQTYTKWGSWGSFEYQDDNFLAAPKWFAQFEFAVWNPKWWW